MVPSTGNHQFIIVRADNVLIAPLSALNLAFRSLSIFVWLSRSSLSYVWMVVGDFQGLFHLFSLISSSSTLEQVWVLPENNGLDVRQQLSLCLMSLSICEALSLPHHPHPLSLPSSLREKKAIHDRHEHFPSHHSLVNLWCFFFRKNELDSLFVFRCMCVPK